MGSSVISEGIVLVAVVIAAATISQVFLSSIGGLQQGSVIMSEKLSDKMETEISILKGVNTSSTTVKVWIKNVGTSIMPLESVRIGDVLFGEYGNFEYLTFSETGSGWDYDILGSTDSLWQPSETIELTITSATVLAKGDYFFSYTTHNGINEELIFSIGD